MSFKYYENLLLLRSYIQMNKYIYKREKKKCKSTDQDKIRKKKNVRL